MYPVILFVHVVISVLIVVLVLMQQGKGAQMGAAFGSGASGTVFGSQGSSSFLFKMTALLAVLFFATSMGLTYMAAHQTKKQGLNLDTIAKIQRPAVPVKKEKV